MKSKDYVKPFKKYPSAPVFLRLPFYPRTAKSVWTMVQSIFCNFFILQNAQKLGFTKRRVVHVDHALDEEIPFTPSNVRIYLDFVWFFCRIMAMLMKRLGLKKAAPLCAAILDFIHELYDSAATIYRYSLTTTKRPFYIARPKFLLIHLSDPHLLCVPSLHVAIVAGIWAKVRALLADPAVSFSIEEKNAILDEIYYGSVAITESVLYVKQHSINCVAGALYMLTAAHDDGFFGAADAKAFIERLFCGADDIKNGAEQKIRAAMYEMYGSLLSQKERSAGPWQQPLHDWLDRYESAR